MNLNDEVTRRIKQRAMLFVIDNYKRPTDLDFVVIENAMMLGSVVRAEVEMDFIRKAPCVQEAAS